MISGTLPEEIVENLQRIDIQCRLRVIFDILQQLSGDLVPLVVISDRRSKALTDVPCTEELGIDVVTTKPRGFYAPSGVDPEKIAILKSAIEKVCANPEFQERVITLGLEVNYQDGEALQNKIDQWVVELTPVFDDMMSGNV